MNDDFLKLDTKLSALITQLSPAKIKDLSKELSVEMRRSNKARISQNIQPDGSRMDPRKRPRKIKLKRETAKSKIRARLMFPKIGQASTLRIKASADSASIYFASRKRGGTRVDANTLAKRHQFGDRSHNLPRRQLLGFSHDDLEKIEKAIIRHLTKD